MRRRKFLVSSSAVATSWVQSATARSLKPESSFDLVDSKTHEIGQLTASSNYIWALARPLRTRTTHVIVRFSPKDRNSLHVPLPEGFYGHLTASGVDRVSVWGAPVLPISGRRERSRWDVEGGTSAVERSDRVLDGEIEGCSFCGDRLVAAFPDGTVRIDADRAKNGGKVITHRVFSAQAMEGYSPPRLVASVVADTPSTAIAVDHFCGRIAWIDLTTGAVSSVVRIGDPAIEKALEASGRYLSTVRDTSASSEKEFRRAVTPAAVSAVCRSAQGRVWVVPSGRYPDKQLMLEVNRDGTVVQRIECLLPGGVTERDKVPMFAASDGVRFYVTYWSGRTYGYLPTA